MSTKSHTVGIFFCLKKINKCLSPKVQKSKSENRPLRLTHRYSYTIHTNEYFILGSILFHWNPKSQSPSVHQISHSGKFYLKKKNKCPSPKVQKANSENRPLTQKHPCSYAMHTNEYFILGSKLSFSIEKSRSPNVHQISHSGKFYFFKK